MLPSLYDSYNNTFLDDFFKHFDSLFKDVSFESGSGGSFPKYNIIKKDNNGIILELALAGYIKDDIEISVRNNLLTISGKKELSDNRNYIEKQISSRTFFKKWTLPKPIEVKDAKLENGILSIDLELIVPEEEKPKLIDIK